MMDKMHRSLLKSWILFLAEVRIIYAFSICSFPSDYTVENKVIKGNYHVNRQEIEN